MAWLAEENAFYVASEHDEPAYAPFVDSLVRGGPVAEHAGAYITTQVAAGIVGPSTWRIGNVRVLSIRGSTALVEGCSYDPGSHYAATGAIAPSSLGGGAGYTASMTTMELMAGRWYVDATAVTSLSSNSGAGPCHGF